VIAPFLRQQGVINLDMLIVSHADKQHTGGVRSLREQMPVGRILTSSLEQTPIDGAELCRVGQDWEWDGVRFRLLHPPATGFVDDEASCVLQVIGSAGRVLLPGDIEIGAETALTAIHGADLAAEVLVAPHQGRRNLSVPAFLAAVQPRYILFSTGYRNRFGYPSSGNRGPLSGDWRHVARCFLRRGTHLPVGTGSAIGAGAIPTRPPSLLDRALTGASPRQIR
jgi:competence protein ComEC